MNALLAGLQAINSAVPPASEDRNLLVAAKCRGLLRGYAERWAASPYVPVAVEQYVASDLVNPQTARRSRTFRIAGKIDLKAMLGERRVIFDHKTTSEDIGDPQSPYWRQLVVEAQPSHYMLLEWLNERKVDEAVWDVVKKPGIRPKKLTKAERNAAATTRLYCGAEVSEQSFDELIATESESLAMYEARLAQDCIAERPQWYFQRRPIPRLDAEIHEWAVDLWDLGQEFISAKASGRHPRNSGACMQYGGPCEFLGICSGHDTPDSDNWRRKSWVHSELPILGDGDGRDILTHSRLRIFQTCRQKEFLKYELGIERQDEEEREAIFFGNLWHLALNAYFQWFITQGGTNGDSNATPANEVGVAT